MSTLKYPHLFKPLKVRGAVFKTAYSPLRKGITT